MLNNDVTIKKVLVTGGAGYVGAVLVPKLLKEGYEVKVIDLYIYGEDVLGGVKNDPNLTQIKGDIRNAELLKEHATGVDAIIHLACISNDPSYELDPILSKSINYDAFIPLVNIAKARGVKRFIYASSSSVYGVKNEPEVTEELTLEPLTDYSKYKAKCEEYLSLAGDDNFTVVTIRPATVCGYSPRLRLDLTVNILTNHAINKGKITVYGGEQKRPNLHIEDMTDVYLLLLKQPAGKIHKKTFNVGFQNFMVKEIAMKVKETLGKDISVEVTSTNDNRSYHISSKKILEELGFQPKHALEEAILDLTKAFDSGKIPRPMDDSRYYNIKRMQEINLK